ncbi:hypothetical protein HRbin04_00602 [archaeon HR04]|nr:hypothetical protein HRbin04_00602 [archaeon HR04]
MGIEKVNYNTLAKLFTKLVPNVFKQDLYYGSRIEMISELVKIFYYDAQYDIEIINQELYKKLDELQHLIETIKKFNELKTYFNSIKNHHPYYDVRLGRIVKINGEPRQKGVDTLLVLDMITMAYQDQYDIAVLVGGDRDFVPAVNIVKNLGKHVYGYYFAKHIADELLNSFDVKFCFDDPSIFPYLRGDPYLIYG